MSALEDASRRPWVRRVAAWTVPALALGGLATAGIRLVLPSAEVEALRSLAPDAPGSTWVYRTETNGEPSGLAVTQIVGTTIFSDGDLVVPAQVVESRHEDFAGFGPLTVLAYRGRVGDSVVAFGRRRQGGVFELVDPPQPGLRLPVRPGDAWSWSGTDGDTPSRYETRVMSMEAMDVLGERSEDCRHLRTDYTFDDGRTEVDDEWVCPEIGVVRSRSHVPDQDLTYETELVEAHLPEAGGGSALPSLGALPDAPTPGSVQGVDLTRANAMPGAELDPSTVVWTDVRRGIGLFPPVGDAGRFLTADQDGTVTLTDTESGEVRWRVRLRGPIVASPVVAGPLVYVADAQKALFALDAETGAARWVARFPDLVSAGPLVAGETVVVTTDDLAVHALRVRDGSPVWDGEMGALVKAPPVLAEGHAVIADEGGSMTAFGLDDGTDAWSVSLEGALTAGPLLADDAVVAADDAGYLSAVEAGSGETRWRRYLGTTVVADIDPAAGGGRVVLPEETASDEDFLSAYELDDGRRAWRARARGPLATPPVIVGDRVAVQTANGRLVTHALEDGRAIDELDLPRLDDRASVDSDDVGPAWIDGALVTSLHTFDPWGAISYVAFAAAAAGDAREPGVGFRGSVRVVGVTWRSAPIRVPAGLVMADDSAVLLLPPSGPPRVLAEASSPWVTAAGERVLAHLESDLTLLDPATGERVWSRPIGDPQFGSRPAIDGDVAYVPTADGLLAVDVPTGRPRWMHPVPAALGIGRPLVLPGGEVVYGMGEIARIDAATGATRWRLPGVVTFGPLAEGAGAVYAQAVSDTASELLSLDAGTGEVRWRVPLATGILTGPVVAGGSVVAVDDRGNAIAVDAADGTLRWTRPARSGPCGPPVALGERVALIEGGRSEDVQERDYRVTVVDGATGRYLGAVEPDGTSLVPGDCAALPDGVVVPGSLAAQVLEVVGG